MKIEYDEKLDLLVEQQGGFSTSLSFLDLTRLRAITKRVHMAHIPPHMRSDYEADRIIDVIGPQTAAYLIRQAVDAGKL